jgi:hypothetical protein
MGERCKLVSLSGRNRRGGGIFGAQFGPGSAHSKLSLDVEIRTFRTHSFPCFGTAHSECDEQQ